MLKKGNSQKGILKQKTKNQKVPSNQDSPWYPSQSWFFPALAIMLSLFPTYQHTLVAHICPLTTTTMVFRLTSSSQITAQTPLAHTFRACNGLIPATTTHNHHFLRITALSLDLPVHPLLILPLLLFCLEQQHITAVEGIVLMLQNIVATINLVHLLFLLLLLPFLLLPPWTATHNC